MLQKSVLLNRTHEVGIADFLAKREGATMADVQVTCITTSPRNKTDEGITHLGGAGWTWTRQKVIVSIEGATNTFYLMDGDKRHDVMVVDGPYGKYLRAHAEGEWTDSLLALPDCE